MSDENADSWAFSEAKDWKDGRHSRENRHVGPHAGEMGGATKARQTLSAVRGAFERAEKRGWIEQTHRTPDRAEETVEWRQVMAYHSTESFAKAVQAGAAGKMRAHVGSEKREPDISGIRALRTIEDLIADEAMMLYIFGHMGNGKSFFASLLAELWESIIGGIVGGNTRSIEAAETITTWPALEDWMKEDESTVMAGEQTRKLFIFDEASSKASGRGRDGWDASTKLATMCYKIRKHGGSLIVVGHDGKDVHPAVREMCTAFHKTDTKTGQFFESVKNRKGRNPVTPPLDGIPLPDRKWHPNTNDTAKWSWNARKEDDEYQPGRAAEDMAIWTVIRCKEEGLTNRETAEYVPYSHGWVGSRWREYRDEGLHEETISNVQQVIA